MKFAISPDENPGDTGTTAGGIIERSLNILVGNELVKALQRCGQQVWFDTTITAGQRVAEANANGTDVLFACAHNYSVGGMGEGSIFIFCNAAAHTIGKQLLAATNVGNELVAAGIARRWGTVDEAVYECCAFDKDTIFCEFLYQSNARDLAMINSPGYPTRAAEAACRGLAKTYGFTYVPLTPPAPAQEDDELLYTAPFHKLATPATVKVIPGQSASLYGDPSTSSLVKAGFASGAAVVVTGYCFSSSPVNSADRGAGAGPGPDYVWWQVNTGDWIPDAPLDTTNVPNAPLGAAVSSPPVSTMTRYVALAGSGGGPDDDSQYATKVYVDAQDTAIKNAIPTKAVTTLSP